MGRLWMESEHGSFDESELPGNQGRVAFAALVLERRALSRDELAEIIWGENLPSQWTGALSAVISKLRSLVNGIGLDGRAVVSTSAGAYRFEPPLGCFVDAEDAWRRLDRAEGRLRHGEVQDAVADATVASSILRRPFLPGVEGLWVEQVQHRRLDALYRSYQVLADGWHRQGDHGLAATTARAAIDVDPLRETGHRLLMQAEWARGERAAALRAYERCRRLLDDELGVEPSPETLGLADQIRTALGT